MEITFSSPHKYTLKALQAIYRDSVIQTITHTRTHTHTPAHAHTHILLHTHTHTYSCTRTRTRTRTCTYTCTHTHTHTHTQDYHSVLNSLPETDRPSFFGLPANIERSSQRTISSRVISQLKVLARIEGSGERFDREAWSADLSPLLTLWKKLNQVGRGGIASVPDSHSAFHRLQ